MIAILQDFFQKRPVSGEGWEEPPAIGPGEVPAEVRGTGPATDSEESRGGGSRVT